MRDTLRRRLNSILGASAGDIAGRGAAPACGSRPNYGSGKALGAFLFGVLALLFVGSVLYRLSQPGSDIPSADEVAVPEAGLSRFLRLSKLAAALYLGVRVAMAYEWLNAGWDKLQQPGWTHTGLALRAYWLHAVTVPKPPAKPVITYPAYRGFIQYMLDHAWYTWFAKLVVTAEILIGLGLLLGMFTGVAALAGLLMNFNYLYAGTTSVNPTLIVLEALVLYGWRVAGWYGVDRFLLPRVGTPWAARLHGEHVPRRTSA